MFFKKSATNTAALDSPNTVIGKGVYIEAARMAGTDSIRVEGVFKGNIQVEGSLVLGEGGSILGDVDANYFLVAGEMIGNIKCNTQLHFASTAKVKGDIQTSSLIIDDGSQISGRYIVGVDRMDPSTLEARDEILHLQNMKQESHQKDHFSKDNFPDQTLDEYPDDYLTD